MAGLADLCNATANKPRASYPSKGVVSLLASLRERFPELRCKDTPDYRDWSIQVREALASDNLPIPGAVTIDMPCSDGLSDMLDDAASGNAVALGNLDGLLSSEIAESHEILKQQLPRLHRLVGGDLAAGRLDREAYFALLAKQFGRKVIHLHPPSSEGNPDYRAAHHLRSAIKEGRHLARKAACALRSPATERAD